MQHITSLILIKKWRQMKFTKLEHSGCVVEKDGLKIVCDPVEFERGLPDLENVAAIIITHKHGDHLQLEKLSAVLDKNPEARVFTTEDATDEIPNSRVVKTGDVVNVGGFELKFFGENHAEIVPGKIPCQNIGVVIDGKIVNPGDSFDIPSNMIHPEILLVPSAAPWCKVSEGMEYIKVVKPQVAVPVHNAVLSELGDGFNNNWLRVACEEVGVELVPLGAGEGVEV